MFSGRESKDKLEAIQPAQGQVLKQNWAGGRNWSERIQSPLPDTEMDLSSLEGFSTVPFLPSCYESGNSHDNQGPVLQTLETLGPKKAKASMSFTRQQLVLLMNK